MKEAFDKLKGKVVELGPKEMAIAAALIIIPGGMTAAAGYAIYEKLRNDKLTEEEK